MSKRLTITKFIETAKSVHGDKYDYSLVEYKNVDTNIIIVCPIHGQFKQTPYTHKTGSGCSKCRAEKLSLKFRDNKTVFIDKARLIHGDSYDYSLVDYKNQMSKVSIICKDHGEFKQIPNSHLLGRGCPLCGESKGEKNIREFLTKNNIRFVPQYKFDNCINKRKLPFDFYLPDYNICIEYQGTQHFSYKNGGFGASIEDSMLDYQKLTINDNIKKEFCKNNKIDLLIISYMDNINEKLSIKFKGILNIVTEDGLTIAKITNN